jgi:hypothetical protein
MPDSLVLAVAVIITGVSWFAHTTWSCTSAIPRVVRAEARAIRGFIVDFEAVLVIAIELLLGRDSVSEKRREPQVCVVIRERVPDCLEAGHHST